MIFVMSLMWPRKRKLTEWFVDGKIAHALDVEDATGPASPAISSLNALRGVLEKRLDLLDLDDACPP